LGGQEFVSKIHFCITAVGHVKDWAHLSEFHIPYSEMIKLKKTGEIETIEGDLVIKISARELNKKELNDPTKG
jgi:hypothetical protein